MKPLQLNPCTHEITLREVPLPSDILDDVGIMDVQFQFGMCHGGHVFTSQQLEQIGKWFLRASERAKRSRKKAGGDS